MFAAKSLGLLYNPKNIAQVCKSSVPMPSPLPFAPFSHPRGRRDRINFFYCLTRFHKANNEVK